MNIEVWAQVAPGAAPDTSPGVALAALAIVATIVAALLKVFSTQTARGDAAQVEHIKTLIDTRAATEERAERAEERAGHAERRADEASREAEACRRETETMKSETYAMKRKTEVMEQYIQTLIAHMTARGLDPPPWPRPPL